MNRSVGKIVKQVATVVLTLAIVVASVLWLSNYFGEKIPAEPQVEKLLLIGKRLLKDDGNRLGNGERGDDTSE